MNSRLYSGTTSHARVRPVANSFTYGIYYVYVDLDELPQLDQELRHFGYNRRAQMSVWDVDHGPLDGSSLRVWMDGILSRAGIDLEGGSVRLLTFPRVWGFRFYPVSFWYCFHADGTCRAVLAEVQNTYRDHHNYLLHNHGAPMDWSKTPQHDKAFFVSPFVQLEDVRYRFKLSVPEHDLSVLITDIVEGSPLLTASIALHALPLDDITIPNAVRRLGAISLRALVLIHWQAVKLLFKRVGIYPHTPPPEEETSL